MNQLKCPHCQNDDVEMMEEMPHFKYFCTVCSKVFRYDPQSESQDNSSSNKETFPKLVYRKDD